MKQFYLFLLLIVCGLTGYAQAWQEQNSPTTSDLRVLSFSSELVGWAAGDEGILVKTTDGGTNWSIQSTGVSVQLFAACFITDDKGFIGGGSGTFLKTLNGGQTWQAVDLGVTQNIKSIFFLNENIGWVSGSSPAFMKKTVDGGNTWTNLMPPPLSNVMDMHWLNESECWLVGSDTYGAIVHTTDGGNTWQVMTPSTINCDMYTDLHFFSSMEGFVTGLGGDFIKTEDGGNTWTVENFTMNFNDIWCLDFSSAQTGLITQNSTIRRTVDGGDNWLSELSDVNAALFDIISINDSHAVAVGTDGRITRYGCMTPPPTGAELQVFCESSSPTLADIQLTGQGIIWYGLPNGGLSISEAALLEDGETYYAAQTGGTNCISTERLAVTVEVNDVDVTITQNGNTLSSNQAGATYQWINCQNNQDVSNATGQIFTPQSSGSYAVEVTYDGCTDVSTCVSVNVNGVEQTTAVSELNIYPNPAKDQITVDVSAQMGNSPWQLFTCDGRMVKFGAFSAGTNTVFIHELEAGVYFLQVVDKVSRLIVE